MLTKKATRKRSSFEKEVITLSNCNVGHEIIGKGPQKANKTKSKELVRLADSQVLAVKYYSYALAALYLR
ncbi:hypothetical protein ACFL9T_02900 [Thermodesulfobacteriota bacterium]